MAPLPQIRMPGSTEARKAWIVLRGPYFAAYLALFALIVVAVPATPGLTAWRIAAGGALLALIVGSWASWLVVSSLRSPKHVWVRLEALELTGIRMLMLVEMVFGLFTLFKGGYKLSFSMGHIAVGLLVLGMWTNMTWHKAKGIANG